MKKEKQILEDQYDVILIGAGIGGLLCTNYLAMKGYRPLLLEKHHIPGGYLTGFYRKGFYFDAGDQSFGGCFLVWPSLQELGLKEKVEFCRAKWRFVSPGIDIVIEDLEEVTRAFSQAFPEEGKGMIDFFAEIQKGLQRLKSGDFALQDLKGVSKKELLERYFRSKPLINLLMKNGYPNWSAAIEVLYWFLMLEDYWHVKGGTQQLSNALAQNIINHGGTIAYQAQAKKILVEDGWARGVKIEDGRVIRSRAVVACCDLKQTFGKLIDKSHLDPSWRKRLLSLKESETFVAVYLGTDIPPEEMKERLKVHHCTVYDNYDFAWKMEANDPDLHKKTFFEVTSPSMDNPGLAPEGESSLIIRCISHYEWMDTWRTGTGKERTKANQGLKELVAQQMIKITERVIPDLSRRILLKDVGTPLTHERYTFNSRGASAGWSWNMDDAPFDGSSEMVIQSPIPNLYMASHWTASKGGGVPIAWESGKMVAEALASKGL